MNQTSIYFGEGSLADEAMTDPDGFHGRIQRQARSDADQWFEEQMARRERLRRARARQRRRSVLDRLMLGWRHPG